MRQTLLRFQLFSTAPAASFITKATQPLVETHKEFLELVGDVGEGRVKLDMQRYERIAELVIDQPARRNAVSGRMMRQLADAVDHLLQSAAAAGEGATKDQPVGLIIRGTGGEAFCAGADLGLVGEVVNTPERGAMMSAFMTDALNRLRQSALISVACLNGTALGGGAELATAADFRIQPSTKQLMALAAEPAHEVSGQLRKTPNFTLQFVHAKIGASPGWGGARRLVNIVGRQKALLICAAAKPITAEQGEAMGLIDQVLAPPPLLQQKWRRLQIELQSGEAGGGGSIADFEDFCNQYYSEAARDFLEPFVSSMLFADSVRAIKTSVASVEDETSDASKDIEQLMFRSRWFSRDNVKGLHSTPLNFFKSN